MDTVAQEARQTTRNIVWDAILGLTADDRSISRTVLRDVTGLSLSVIDDHVERLVRNDKLMKVGRGLLEVVQRHPAARPQTLSLLSCGTVKYEIGDACINFTPEEARAHGLMFAGLANAYHHVDGNHKALIRTGELSLRLSQVEQTLHVQGG